MKIIDLTDLTEDFFQRTEEEKINCIDNFYNLFVELLQDPEYDNELVLQHIDNVIRKSEEDEAFELSHVFYQVKKRLENKPKKRGRPKKNQDGL